MNIELQEGFTTVNSGSPCPSPDQFLRLSEMKLSRREATEARAHLEKCDSCRELTELMAAPTAANPLPAAALKQDRDLLARRLGFAPKPSLIQRLLEFADTLWKVKTPLLVPVASTALLLFLLLPASPPVARKAAPPLAHQYSDVTKMVSSSLRLRSSSGIDSTHQAPANSVILFQHQTLNPQLAAGESITLEILSGVKEKNVEISDTVSAQGLVEVPLIIHLPGRYRIRLLHGESKQPLTELDCLITPPVPRTP